MADPDWTDPCAVYAWLAERHAKVIAGQTVVSMSHGETSRTFTKASVREMAALMRQKFAECQAKQGKRARRAIVAG